MAFILSANRFNMHRLPTDILFVCLLLSGLFLSSRQLSAQDITFTHLSTDDGLPSNIIVDVLQDHRGYLWLGTRGGGLVRYDGYDMKIFRHVDGDPASLSADWITALYESADGTLWIGTEGDGLNRYDATTDTFEAYRHETGNPASLSDDRILSIYESSDGVLWIGTVGGGLNRFNSATGAFETFRHVAGDSTSLSLDKVESILETRDGTLWIGTDGGGLNRFDRATETFEVFRHVAGNPTSLSQDEVQCLYETSDGTLWIGTDGGLNRLVLSEVEGSDAATETFEVFLDDPDDPTSLSYYDVESILETTDGTLWIGTESGLNRLVPFDELRPALSSAEGAGSSTGSLRQGSGQAGQALSEVEGSDATTETFEVFRHIAGDPASLSHDHVFSMVETTDGTLWIGTLGGLNRYDAALETFKVYRHVEGDPTSMSQDEVRSIWESADGTLWVGTGGGVNRYDPASGTFEVYRHAADDSTTLRSDRIRALLESADGTLWVGTGGGLIRFDPFDEPRPAPSASPGGTAATETFKTFRHLEGDPTSLSHDRITSIYESPGGTLWIGTEGGLNRLVPSISSGQALSEVEGSDKASETFEVYRHIEGDPNSLSDDRIRSIHESSDGTLWVGTFSGGLNRFDPSTSSGGPATTGSFEAYQHIAGDPTSLGNNTVNAIYETAAGALWIGTPDGLNRLERDPDDPARIAFSRFLAGTGSDVSSILEDEEGYLWLGLFNSGRLVRFDPATGQSRFFGKRHGLPAGSFSQGAVRSRAGMLYWGNSAGMVVLDPDRLTPPAEPPALYLSELSLFNEPLVPGPGSPLEHALWQTEKLRLSHAQNELTFGFVGIQYARPEETYYQFRLLGYDDDWRSETTQRRATYTNLAPATYTFEVKAANSDGIWTPEPVRLVVEIRPPTWRTGWAYVFYGLLLIGGVFALDRIQRRRLIARERHRAEIEQERFRAEAAERELEQAREIEKAYLVLRETKDRLVQQAKMASLGRLTAGIAHEIKNPLNFVFNFADLNEELIGEILDEIKAHPDMPVKEIEDTITGLRVNSSRIAKHGKKVNSIVQSMIQHTGGGCERDDVAINPFIEELITITYSSLQSQKPDLAVTIEKNLDEGVGSLRISPIEIGRVVQNILSNAFEAVLEKKEEHGEAYVPEVSVSTSREDGQVEIRVSDNGPGIPVEARDRIFEPFFTTKPAGTNTGLGLSLSYDIVTKGHGGSLDLESEIGEGATFILRLPGEGG